MAVLALIVVGFLGAPLGVPIQLTEPERRYRRHRTETPPVEGWLGLPPRKPPIVETKTTGWNGEPKDERAPTPEPSAVPARPSPQTASQPVTRAVPPQTDIPPPPGVGLMDDIRKTLPALPPQVANVPPMAKPEPSKPELTTTSSTDINELAAQCKKNGNDLLKTSFRENSGMEASLITSVVVNPNYAKSLADRSGILDTMFPCTAKIATDKGELAFFFEVKDIGGFKMMTGQFPLGQTRK